MKRCIHSRGMLAFCFAGILVSYAFGQSSSSQSTGSTSQPAAQQGSSESSVPAKPGKPKKVWTEDDIGSLKGNVSVVGDASKARKASQKSQKDNQAEASLPPEKDPAWYRKQLAPLRARVEQLDAEIRKMRGVQGGKETSDAGRRYNGFDLPMNSQDRMEQLEKKRKDLQAKIDSLEDQARRNGLNPGELR